MSRFVPANSLRGRQLTRAKGSRDASATPQHTADQEAWNRRIEEQKRAKAARKATRRST